jgi:hypothetical protein
MEQSDCVPSTGARNSVPGNNSAISSVEGRLMTVSALAMTKLSNPRLVVSQRADDALGDVTSVDIGP